MVDLIERGSTVPVTDANKLQYLDALAQYRLVTRVKDELHAFLKGFNDLVPDNLLCMFDEYELEVSADMLHVQVQSLSYHLSLLDDHSTV